MAKFELGGGYVSNVDLDRDVRELLRGVVAQLLTRGVSKRHVIAALGRVLRNDLRQL